MTDCAFELVATSGIAKAHNMTVIFRERVDLHRLAGPGTGPINAVGHIENTHRTFFIHNLFVRLFPPFLFHKNLRTVVKPLLY